MKSLTRSPLMIVVWFWMLLAQASLARFDAVATDTCAAFNDLRHQRNEGDLHLQPKRSYRVIREHKGQYLVKLPSTPPTQRWVDRRCLSRTANGDKMALPEPSDSALRSLLVLSWHDSFCRSHPQRKECRPLYNHASGRLVLHGLWPQPRSRVYCGISAALKDADRAGRWRALPEPRLDDSLRRLLLRYMPGSLSGLHRHEWIKHGSCYDPDPARYFHDALTLTETVDRSMLGEYLRANAGGRVTLARLRRIFERSFGRGNGRRLAMECRRGMLQGLRIALAGKDDRLETLLKKAPPLKSRCQEAVVPKPRY